MMTFGQMLYEAWWRVVPQGRDGEMGGTQSIVPYSLGASRFRLSRAVHGQCCEGWNGCLFVEGGIT